LYRRAVRRVRRFVIAIKRQLIIKSNLEPQYSPDGREHSIQWLARERNVDCLSLAGRLLGGRASEVEAKRKFTIAEAFETWTARSEGEESRNRKVKAEAEVAEDPQRLNFR
jgi:hypothetical protein